MGFNVNNWCSNNYYWLYDCDGELSTMKEEDLDDLMERASANLNESTELGEISKDFKDNTPSSSNLTPDEFRLAWRGINILKRMSPSSVAIIEGFVDMKRSVGGWNTDRKVEAITGVQQQRSGNSFMDKLFKPKQ